MENTPELIIKLSHLEIFSDLDPENEEHYRIFNRLCAILEPVEFAAGEAIIREGETGDSLFILYSGEVQVRRKTPEGEQFATANLDATKNVFFGEVALVDRDTRSASVYALTLCKTLRLDGKMFKTLCTEEPLLGFFAMNRIACRIASSLRRANKDILLLYEALLDEVHGE